VTDIIFIHGLFMNPKSWANWTAWFSERGFRCHAPPWPGHDGEPAALRAQPPEVLRTLTLGELVATYRAFVATLDAKPIVIGHSLGGLVAQLLLNRDLAAAAVAIDPAPPKGIFVPSWSFLRCNLPVINPLAGNKPFSMSLKRFHYAFCNTLTLDEARPIFDAFVVPEARNVARGTTSKDAAIDFARPHAPLLIIGGERDHIVPWRLNQKNFRAYRHAGSTRSFHVMPGRDHFLCGQRGWQEVAELANRFLGDHVTRTLPAAASR
jgi:pimeloyl-ACP methyl ester carboxylesterase